MAIPVPSLAWETFYTPKAGHTLEEYEDRFAGDPASGRFAVADGASESAFAGQWARNLVDAYIRAPESWLPDARKRLRSELKSQKTELPWHAEAKFEEGAFSSLLGVAFEEGQWHAEAIGDSCLFQVCNDCLRRGFPIRRSSDFTNQPQLVKSRATRVGGPRTKRVNLSGDCRPGDVFFLMTDALAAWFLKEFEERRQPWKQLGAIQTQEEFAAWVEARRTSGELRNDDVTMVVIRAVTASPPQGLAQITAAVQAASQSSPAPPAEQPPPAAITPGAPLVKQTAGLDAAPPVPGLISGPSSSPISIADAFAPVPCPGPPGAAAQHASTPATLNGGGQVMGDPKSLVPAAAVEPKSSRSPLAALAILLILLTTIYGTALLVNRATKQSVVTGGASGPPATKGPRPQPLAEQPPSTEQPKRPDPSPEEKPVKTEPTPPKQSLPSASREQKFAQEFGLAMMLRCSFGPTGLKASASPSESTVQSEAKKPPSSADKRDSAPREAIKSSHSARRKSESADNPIDWLLARELDLENALKDSPSGVEKEEKAALFEEARTSLQEVRKEMRRFCFEDALPKRAKKGDSFLLRRKPEEHPDEYELHFSVVNRRGQNLNDNLWGSQLLVSLVDARQDHSVSLTFGRKSEGGSPWPAINDITIPKRYTERNEEKQEKGKKIGYTTYVVIKLRVKAAGSIRVVNSVGTDGKEETLEILNLPERRLEKLQIKEFAPQIQDRALEVTLVVIPSTPTAKGRQ